MTSTYLDYFNYYLKEFCNEIINNFPQYRDLMLTNYRPLLENRDDKNDMYVKFFLTAVNNHIEKIYDSDESLFSDNEDLLFLLGVNFVDLWVSNENNDSTKKSIWEYLQLLTSLSRNIVVEHEEILELLKNVNESKLQAPSKMIRTLENEVDDNINDDSSASDTLDMVNNIMAFVGGNASSSNSTFNINKIKALLSGFCSKLGLKEVKEQIDEFDVNKILGFTGLSEEDLSVEKLKEKFSDPHNVLDFIDTIKDNLKNYDPNFDSNSYGTIFTFLRSFVSNFMNHSDTSTNTTSDNSDDTESNDTDNAPSMTEIFNKTMTDLMQDDNIKNLLGNLMGNQGSDGNNDMPNPMSMMQNMMNNPMFKDMAEKMASQMARTNPGMAEQAQRQRSRQGATDARSRLKAKLDAKRKKQQQNNDVSSLD
jgi:hypothetical protein